MAGRLALHTVERSEHLEVVCGRCGRLAALIGVWSHCKYCREVLLQLLHKYTADKYLQDGVECRGVALRHQSSPEDLQRSMRLQMPPSS